MKIRTQFIITMLLFGVVLAAIAASAMITNVRVENASEQDRIAHNIAQGASELSYLANDYVMYGESQQLERWQTRFDRFSADVAGLQANLPEQQILVQNIQANTQRLQDVFGSVIAAVQRASTDQGATASLEMVQTSWSRLAVQSQGLISDASRLSEVSGNQVDRLQRTNSIVVIALIGGFLLYFLVNYWIVQRRVLKSITNLQAGAEIIGSGNLDFKLEERSNDEIGDLSRAFNQMAADLNTATANIVAERRRLYNVLETLPAMICLLTPDHRIAFANRSFRENFGEPGPRHCYESCFGNPAPCEFCESYRVLESGQPHHWQLTTPDGATTLDVYDFPFTDVDGSPMILEMNLDITAQKAAEAALVQAERLSIAGKLAASVAHEINNPLQSVLGCLGLAQGALKDGKTPDAYLQIAHQEVQRTARIVGQLRSLGRPVRGSQRELADLNNLLDDLLVLNKKHFQSHRVDVVWEPCGGLPMTVVAPDAIRQVFLNLMLNAVDAMPEGGQLRLSTSRIESPAGARVVVADTGTGIPEDALPRIFDAFYTTKREGMGVGLYICQQIVEEHGGYIEVTSSPGLGTTFTVSLPAGIEPRASSAQPTSNP